MKTLYLQCSLGVSGDMLLAALSDMLPEGARILEDAVAALGLPGVSVRLSEQMIQGVRTRRVEVLEQSPQPLRHLSDLTDIVNASVLPDETKRLGLAALTSLAEAESRVHGESLEHIHFHEVGAVDTVVDAVCSVHLALAAGAVNIAASPVNLGSGFVEFSHGRFPVPAPAVAELARGMRTFATESGMELATPTGMSVIKTLAADYGPLPEGSILAVGYGSGTYSAGAYPTLLRAFLIQEDRRRARPDHDHGDDARDGGSGPVIGRGDLFGPHGHPHHGPHAHTSGGREFAEDEAD